MKITLKIGPTNTVVTPPLKDRIVTLLKLGYYRVLLCPPVAPS
jgi:hypothetical protein